MDNIKQIFKELAVYLGKKFEVLSAQNETIANKLDEIARKEVTIIQVRGDTGPQGPRGNDSYVPGPKGDTGPAPTKEQIEEVVKPLMPNEVFLRKLIEPLIPAPIPGPKGDPSTVPGPKGNKGDSGKDGSPDTGEQIVDKINADKSKKVIKKEHVEGLAEIESMARTAEANTHNFNTGSYVYDYDISSLLDGVTKTFTLPANARVITVLSSSTPTIFRKTVDYTTTASAITFTSEITASSTLASGQSVIILYKIL